MDLRVIRLGLMFGAAKGFVLTVAMAALDIAFWKQLIVAFVSSSIGFAGVVVASYIAVREARRNRHELRTIKRAIGADRRETDNGGTGSDTDRDSGTATDGD